MTGKYTNWSNENIMFGFSSNLINGQKKLSGSLHSPLKPKTSKVLTVYFLQGNMFDNMVWSYYGKVYYALIENLFPFSF